MAAPTGPTYTPWSRWLEPCRPKACPGSRPTVVAPLGVTSAAAAPTGLTLTVVAPAQIVLDGIAPGHGNTARSHVRLWLHPLDPRPSWSRRPEPRRPKSCSIPAMAAPLGVTPACGRTHWIHAHRGRVGRSHASLTCARWGRTRPWQHR